MLSLSQIFDDFWPVSGRLVFFVMNEFSNFLFDFIEFGVPTSVSVQNISQMIGQSILKKFCKLAKNDDFSLMKTIGNGA